MSPAAVLALFAFFALALTRPARAVENLNCELTMTSDYEVAPGHAVRLGANDIVVRGPLEASVVFVPKSDVRFGVRDQFGFDEVFPLPEDSLYVLSPGDRVFILEPRGEVLVHGFYTEIRKPTMVDWNKVDWDTSNGEVDLAHPGLSADPDVPRPRIAVERLVELFDEHRPAVVVKTLAPEDLRRLRDRLNPQIKLYEDHRRDAARFVEIAKDVPPYEMRVFEAKIEGRLSWKGQYPDFRKRPKHKTYALDLRLITGRSVTRMHAGDRLFVLRDDGTLLTEFEVRHQPTMVTVPIKDERTLRLLEAMGHEARTVLIRKVAR